MYFFACKSCQTVCSKFECCEPFYLEEFPDAITLSHANVSENIDDDLNHVGGCHVLPVFCLVCNIQLGCKIIKIDKKERSSLCGLYQFKRESMIKIDQETFLKDLQVKIDKQVIEKRDEEEDEDIGKEEDEDKEKKKEDEEEEEVEEEEKDEGIEEEEDEDIEDEEEDKDKEDEDKKDEEDEESGVEFIQLLKDLQSRIYRNLK